MVSEIWTVRRVLKWCTDDFRARNLPSPRLDAEVLLAHALSVDRVRLYMDLDRPLAPSELASVRGFVERRRGHEPIAHIRGFREFWGRPFLVSKAVLVPRPETEMLVEHALNWLNNSQQADLRILDLCSGSGCVGLSLAKDTSAHVVLSDVSAEAMRVAEENAQRLGVDARVDFVVADAFSGVVGQEFDIVVTNPPYLRSQEIGSLAKDVRDFDPHLALDGGADGLDFYRRLAVGIRAHLRPSALVLAEVGHGQADEVASMLRAQVPDAQVEIHVDLAGIPRVVELSLGRDTG